MTRITDPVDVDDALRLEYEVDYRKIERWRDYGLGGDMPTDLVEDDALRSWLASPNGRELVATCTRILRVQIRQLMSCIPDDVYNSSEILQLRLQAMGLHNELNKLITSQVRL